MTAGPRAPLASASPARTTLACLRRGAQALGLTDDGAAPAIEDRTSAAATAARAAAAFGLMLEPVPAAGLRAACAEGPVLLALTNGNAVLILADLATPDAGPEDAAADGVSQDASGDDVALLFDPLADAPDGRIAVPWRTLRARWSGMAQALRPLGGPRAATATGQPAAEAPAGFGYRWFLTQIAANRRFFVDVAALSGFLHLLTLAPPLFFQLVVDRVLPHQVPETLAALTAGVVAAIGFATLFSYARDRLLLHAADRIDAALQSDAFAHLVSLPLRYFDVRRVGVLVKHMQQPEAIRQFLTGRLALTLLNASALVVVLPLLAFYNSRLAALTLGLAAAMTLVIALMVRALRARLHRLYAVEGARQAMLVETLQGVATVKAMAMEEDRAAGWDHLTAESVEARHAVQRLAIRAQAALGFFEQIMTAAVVAVGALSVIAGEMTVGALIAFQMLAARVTAPLLELVGLIHEAQEARLAMRMLADVMDAPPESPPDRRRKRPRLEGAIRFERVGFTYPGAARPALSGVTCEIPAGAFVGVVGRSGSGKTTFAQLILGHRLAQEGVVRLDGHDVAGLDLRRLRRQIGVVPQDVFLFSGSIADNIAAAAPGAAPEAIEAAAETAGAMDFIEALPDRMDTMIEEGGRNLSGGQRQRLGLARALLTQSPILLLDEATSALDPESEAQIRARLDRLRRGRTVVMISHRLSMLTEADVVLVLHEGRLVQSGPHRALLRQPGLYARLWRRQAAPYLADCRL